MAERLTDVAGLVAAGRARRDRPPARARFSWAASPSCSSPPWSRCRTPAVGRQARRLLPARLVEPARLFVHSGRALLSTRALAVALGLSVVSWFFECLAFSLILDGLGVVLPLRVATFVYAFASLAGAVSMLPGGLGVAEGSLTGSSRASGPRSPKRRPRPCSCGAPRCGSPSPSASSLCSSPSRMRATPTRRADSSEHVSSAAGGEPAPRRPRASGSEPVEARRIVHEDPRSNRRIGSPDGKLIQQTGVVDPDQRADVGRLASRRRGRIGMRPVRAPDHAVRIRRDQEPGPAARRRRGPAPRLEAR